MTTKNIQDLQHGEAVALSIDDKQYKMINNIRDDYDFVDKYEVHNIDKFSILVFKK